MPPPNLPRLRELVEQVEEEIDRLITEGEINHRDRTLPFDIRDKLLRMGCSIEDYVFWVARRAQPSDLGNKPEDQRWYAEEMETGMGAWGISPREAVNEYFR
jgi:hypothetical protein